MYVFPYTHTHTHMHAQVHKYTNTRKHRIKHGCRLSASTHKTHTYTKRTHTHIHIHTHKHTHTHAHEQDQARQAREHKQMVLEKAAIWKQENEMSLAAKEKQRLMQLQLDQEMIVKLRVVADEAERKRIRNLAMLKDKMMVRAVPLPRHRLFLARTIIYIYIYIYMYMDIFKYMFVYIYVYIYIYIYIHIHLYIHINLFHGFRVPLSPSPSRTSSRGAHRQDDAAVFLFPSLALMCVSLVHTLAECNRLRTLEVLATR